MLRVSPIESVLLLLVGSCMVLRVLAATCYHLDGTNAGPSNSACNTSATSTEGSHSACCNSDNSDACLSTGLCLNTLSTQQSHLLWATGCTDSTFRDPNCPQYCQGLRMENPHLKACNDSNFWCCESSTILNTDECCGQAFKLTHPIGTVVAQLQSGIGAIPLATGSASLATDLPTPSATTAEVPTVSPTETSTDISTTIPSGAVAGLAVEAVIIVFSLAGLGFVLWRNRLLNLKVKEAGAAAVAATNAQEQLQQLQLQQQQYQWQPSPSSNGGTISHMAGYAYGSPVESEPPKRSELNSPGAHGYPELAGTEIGAELSSEPKTPGSPFARSPSHRL
ncbi:hypothetical protein GGR54DRAFT_621530 [Hypoxylon sp. NC1633]|nr:hypothetical protein GGR54DRAFT_621530 [Hypoxylon sp. NC1633]